MGADCECKKDGGGQRRGKNKRGILEHTETILEHTETMRSKRNGTQSMSTPCNDRWCSNFLESPGKISGSTSNAMWNFV